MSTGAVTLPAATPPAATPPPTVNPPAELTQQAKAALVQANHQAFQASLYDTYVNASSNSSSTDANASANNSNTIPTLQQGLYDTIKQQSLGLAGIGNNISASQ